MPDRIKRDHSTSAKFDDLPGNAETLFFRLLNKVDDFGRFDGDPLNVKGATYPRAQDLRAHTVGAWLKELSDRRLICCYQRSGKPFLALVNFRQRLRGKPKYPPPEDKPPDWMPDDGDWRTIDSESPPYSESDTESGSKTPTKLTTKRARDPETWRDELHESPSPESQNPNGKANNPAKRRLTLAELTLAARFEVALNGGWRNDAGKWVNRIKQVDATGAVTPGTREKSERVIAEVENASKENRIKTTPAQYAEEIWKEFK